MHLRHICTLILMVVIFSTHADAQDVSDSTAVLLGQQDTLVIDSNEIIEIETDTLENRPNTASLYAAALPGLGQAYNKKYWKIPILYGSGLVLGYYINYNNQLYKQYRDGLIAMIDQDDRTVPFDSRLGQDDYERAVDYWRRNRDLLMIGVAVLYLVGIVDAHVDAHLEVFTVDDDISLNLEPSFDYTAMHTNLYGISLKLRF
jgi:hypothetical protein